MQLDQKCDIIHKNLLLCHDSMNEFTASAYIREFFETSQCDEVYDFSAFRRKIERRLNDTDGNRLQRILEFQETDLDEKVGAQVCLHYRTALKKQLLKTLSRTDWIAYHTIGRGERALMALGIFGSTHGCIYAGFNAASASFLSLRDKLRK